MMIRPRYLSPCNTLLKHNFGSYQKKARSIGTLASVWCGGGSVNIGAESTALLCHRKVVAVKIWRRSIHSLLDASVYQHQLPHSLRPSPHHSPRYHFSSHNCQFSKRRLGKDFEVYSRRWYNKGDPPVMHNIIDSHLPVQQIRSDVLQKVQEAIQKKFGKQYTVEIFGSIRYGASFRHSDLDMVVIDPERAHGFDPHKPQDLPRIYNIRKLAKALQKADFKINEVIPFANVPIIKFKDPVSGLDCDINVNDRLGVINSELIMRYCDIFPLLRPMLVVIKLWAKRLGMNSPSKPGAPVTFSSYALALMTIGFLQNRCLLPNLQANIEPLAANAVEGTFWLSRPKLLRCDTRILPASGFQPAKVDLDALVQDWFNFWAECDYSLKMISIREGGLVNRIDIKRLAETYSDTGSERSVHEDDLPNQVDMPRISETKGICVVDPFIYTKNVAVNISPQVLARFKGFCYDAATQLKQGTTLKNLILSGDIFQGNHAEVAQDRDYPDLVQMLACELQKSI